MRARTLRGRLGCTPSRTTGSLGSDAIHGSHKSLSQLSSRLSYRLLGHRLPVRPPWQIKHGSRKVVRYPVRKNQIEGGLGATYHEGTREARHSRRPRTKYADESIRIR